MLPKYAKQVYSALFAASWHTIRAFAEDPKYLGAKTGMVAVLHSWANNFGCTRTFTASCLVVA
jgi:hypothetical protein